MEIKIEDFDLLVGEVRALKGMYINLRDIVEGGIISNNLHADAIKGNNIKDNVITGDKIIADTITAKHIQSLAIDASKIAVGTITSDQIKDGTIAADDIKSGTITALQISTGTITAGLLKTGGQAFSHNMTFSSTDADTVSWTSGTLKTADGTIYSIDAGNTGNMSARTYIYLDKSVSETVLQTSTSYDAPLGDNRIPIATAQNGTGNAIFTVFQGGGGVFISGGMIAAHTITATQITAGTITASEITVSNLQSLSATLGTVHAGLIYGTRLKIGGGTNEDIYFEDSAIRMYDAISGNYKRIYFKYSTLNFCQLTHYTTSNITSLYLFGTSTYYTLVKQSGSICGEVVTNSGYLNLIAGSKTVRIYSAGFLQMPNVASQPSLTGKSGSFIYGNNFMHIVSDAPAIYKIDVSSGW